MENIQEYGIGIEFDSALKGLRKFQTQAQKFNEQQNKVTKKSLVLKAQQAKREKIVNDAMKERNSLAKQGAKIREQEAKQSARNRSSVESARRRQAVAGLTSSGGMSASGSLLAQQLRAEEAKGKASEKVAKQRERAVASLKRSVFYLGLSNKEALEQQLLTAKTAGDVKRIANLERIRLREAKQISKQYSMQDKLLQRMKTSSQQFAGNMVSAFAVAAGVAGVTRVGQDFEAVRNTMLAVSEDTKQAGENFKFAKDEAFRLGLGLKESAKGFAKLVAARGEMSLTDTKAAFTGIAEMSTLLGLSAAESTRALNALQQIDGLPYTEMYL